eukprot:SAG11_NODE_384_length_9897_cov_11.158502_9_plen_111_part_00
MSIFHRHKSSTNDPINVAWVVVLVLYFDTNVCCSGGSGFALSAIRYRALLSTFITHLYTYFHLYAFPAARNTARPLGSVYVEKEESGGGEQFESRQLDKTRPLKAPQTDI